MTGIGTDTELGSKRDAIRVANTLRELLLPPLPLSVHRYDIWLDLGVGDSLMRRAMARKFDREPETIDADLDGYGVLVKSADVITSIELIEHLLNPLHHMDWVRQSLTTKGKLFLTTPNDYSLVYKAEHMLSKKYSPHFHQFSEGDLRELCRRSGIKVLHLRKFRRSRGMGTLARFSYNGLLLVGERA